MTGNPKNERTALERLADALVDDILNTSEEDILAEVMEGYGDPGKLAEDMRSLFERTVYEEGKTKLADLKKAVAEASKRGISATSIDPRNARRRYESMVANDSDLSAKLTLAARKGEGQSERDLDSAIEDLTELGAFDDEEENDT